MRQILFRINLESPFSWTWSDPASGLPLIGSFWLLTIVLMGWALWTCYQRGRQWKAEDYSSLSTFAVLGVVSLSAPWWAPANLSSVPVFGYGAMLLLSFWSAGTYAAWRARQQGLPEKLMWDLAIVILMSGIAGARVFYLIQKREQVFAGVESVGQFLFKIVNLPDGGIVLYGGVIGGAIAYVLFCRFHQLSALNVADIITPSIFLGLGFGRIGCFLNGCCFGDYCELPWGVSYPAGTNTFDALVYRGEIPANAEATPLLHPTQIYSSLNAFLLAAVTANYYVVRPYAGSVLAVGWIIYPITRFLIERIRADELGQLGTGLTISQLISLIMAGLGVAFAVWMRSRQARVAKLDGGKAGQAQKTPVASVSK